MESWLTGPLPNIPILLQPVAHALTQSRRELYEYLDGFPDGLLHVKPAGRASVAFHLKHLTGVLDRMLTYAKKESLHDHQLEYLKNEEKEDEKDAVYTLIKAFDHKIDDAIAYLKTIDPSTLIEVRTVGREKTPSTFIGIIFHAAEHSQRHVGQLLVTSSILKYDENYSRKQTF